MLDAAKRHIGELSMEIELLRSGPWPRSSASRGDAEVATMSATTSAATGRCFGIQRVCQVWEQLALGALRAAGVLGAGPARRGPPPRDRTRLLAAIRTDSRSPFHGEGHARSTHGSDPGRDPRRPTRVLRRHAAARLLSPHRGRPRREGHHPGAQRDVGDGRFIHARRRGGWTRSLAGFEQQAERV